ncbi:hypothetical protein AVDCRST_MAG94-5627, partial [uncultured Leptolyngbya sp.]
EQRRKDYQEQIGRAEACTNAWQCVSGLQGDGSGI